MEIAIRNARGQTLVCADTVDGCIRLLVERIEMLEGHITLLQQATAAKAARDEIAAGP